MSGISINTKPHWWSDGNEVCKKDEDKVHISEHEPFLYNSEYAVVLRCLRENPMLTRLSDHPVTLAFVIWALGSLKPTLPIHAQERLASRSPSDEPC
jgi:hypothetical protein